MNCLVFSFCTLSLNLRMLVFPTLVCARLEKEKCAPVLLFYLLLVVLRGIHVFYRGQE